MTYAQMTQLELDNKRLSAKLADAYKQIARMKLADAPAKMVDVLVKVNGHLSSACTFYARQIEEPDRSEESRKCIDGMLRDCREWQRFFMWLSETRKERNANG